MRLTKSGLGIILSKLKGFYSQKVRVEQYITPSEMAAGIIWFAQEQGDIQEKILADLGCGTGILGLGTMFFNPIKVIFLDGDKEAIEILKSNIECVGGYGISCKSEVLLADISEFKATVDTVIMNPPFGTKKKHADRDFLEAAFKCAEVIYSVHKSETMEYIRKFAASKGFCITHSLEHDFAIPASMAHHTKKLKRIPVTVIRLTQNI